MFSSEHHLNSLITQALSQLGLGGDTDGEKNGGSDNKGDSSFNLSLTPSQILVIAGILAGVLQVNSVLVDKEQAIEILLVGSLRRKTELDKMMDKVGDKSFDEVMAALLRRFG